LPKAWSGKQLASQSDAFYLSMMSRRICRAGLKHSMVDAKWGDFERVFKGFSPMFCAMQSDEFIEACMSDRSIIRHMGKLKSVRANAQFMCDVIEAEGSFGAYLARWSKEQVVELWFELKSKGAHLGGTSAAQFLRMVGCDTFLLSSDVIAVLRLEGVIDTVKAPSSKSDLRSIQRAFNVWHEQSGRDLCEISRVLSFTAL